ncbi:hypothetical protein [Psychrobacter vallis]|uniref:hypothetical protein n=1 Tax=Psychrobacter vallis TaxID=248451 RepID=UPI00191B4AAB|nr:hypothetical protein [Psychrobacter vallis]
MNGISATKALSLAAQQGQTIYTVTKANYAEILPKLNHSDMVMTDIRNGVNAGKTVTVHDTQIRFYSWLGTGYTILDPNSGAGAYMIGGGLDGGFSDFISSVTGWLTLTLTTLADATAGFIHRVISLGFYAATATINFVTSIITNAFLMFRDCDPVTAAILMIPIICATAIFSVIAFVTSIFLVGVLISIIGALVVGYMSSQFREIACRVN